MSKKASFCTQRIILFALFTIVVFMIVACAATSPSQQYINQGQQHYSKREYDQAISNYNKALELDPLNANAYRNRAQAFQLVGDSDQALADHSKTVELDPINSHSSCIGMGYLYNKKGDYNLSIDAYTKALQTPPNPPTFRAFYLAYFGRSCAYALKEEFNNAIIDRKRAEKLVESEEAAKPTLADHLMGAVIGGAIGGFVGGVAESVVHPIPSVSVRPTDILAFTVADTVEKKLLEQHFDEGNAQKNQIEHTKFSNTEYAEIYEMRGYFYYKKGDHVKAIADYSKAIELNPLDKLMLQAYLGRAETFVAVNEYDKAIADAKKVTEIMSNVTDSNDGFVVYGRLGCLYSTIGNYDQALSNFEKGIEIASQMIKIYNDRSFIFGKGHLYFYRGITYYKKGDYVHAIDDYNRALVALVGGLAFWGEGYSHRALAYYAVGKYDQAWNDVSKAQELGYHVDKDFLKKLQHVLNKEK